MNNYTYKIGNKLLTVKNRVEEFDYFFQSRLDMFKTTYSDTDDKVIINKNNVLITINNHQICITNPLKKTDLYQLFNNIISYLIDDENNIYLHSALISKNNKGILLLGNFGAGKTTLATYAEEKGYIINSCDQTWLQIKNHKLYLEQGSIYMKENNFSYNINSEDTVSKVEIVKITFLYGLCDNGIFNEMIIENNDHAYKRIFPFANWHYSVPLITSSIELFNVNDSVSKVINKVLQSNIPISMIRGDKKEIVRQFSYFLSKKDIKHDKKFIMALEKKDYKTLKSIPKTDLHIHGALGSSKNKYRNIPKCDYLNGYSGMKEFIKMHLDKYMHSQEDYYNLIKNSIISAIETGVTIIELSIDIRYYDFFNSIEEYIANLKSLKLSNIQVNFDIGISKSTSIDKKKIIIDLIETRFFTGIDIYGDEEQEIKEMFAEIYEKASLYHLRKKIHIGEFSDEKTIDRMLIYKPNVIEHGISVVNKSNIDDYKYINFNICLSSNLKLGAVKNIEFHPIKEMYNKGIIITINTDDQLIFDNNVIDEYLLLYESGILTSKEINEIRKYGLYF